MADSNLIPSANNSAIAGASPLSSSSLLEMVFWLMLVVAVIFICAWLFRRVGGMGVGASGMIKVLTAISLGSRDRIVLLQVGGKQMLLGISPGRINTLHVFEEDITANTGGNSDLSLNTDQQGGIPNNAFARKLQSFLSGGVNQGMSENSSGSSGNSSGGKNE